MTGQEEQLVPNYFPATVIYETNADSSEEYEAEAYPVGAWRARDGMAMLIVPGMARLVPADTPGLFPGECQGVQRTPMWGPYINASECTSPSARGPFLL